MFSFNFLSLFVLQSLFQDQKTVLVKVLKNQNDNLGRAKICDKKHYVLLENLNEDKDFTEV
jgi:hypothetical protein